jgi:glutaryl-CoA dehydrogenase
LIGSDASHIQTTARRDGDHYVINGEKRWIGAATFADLVVVWAQDDQTGGVGGFVVEKGTPGFTATKIQHKLALRALPNADIKFENCRIPIVNKLVNARSFKDTAAVLRATRLGVAWMAIGVAQAAYEFALAYAKKRQQFGRTIAGFQLIQNKLVDMLQELEFMKISTWRLSVLQDQGKLSDGQASLAKRNNAKKAREICALARELMGGNGILIDNHVARHFADVEAIYSYEGTNEINTLVVGREITGMQAFA